VVDPTLLVQQAREGPAELINLPPGGALMIFERSRKILIDELENADGEVGECEMSFRTGKKQSKSVGQNMTESAAFAAVSWLSIGRSSSMHRGQSGNVPRVFSCTCRSVHFVQRIRVSIATPSCTCSLHDVFLFRACLSRLFS
jgi:hypothetical protein